MQIPQMPVKKQKLEALDFIRAVCAVGVVVYHVSCYSAPEAPKLFYTFANGSGDVGAILVGIFLLMSGGVLFYNYGKEDTMRTGTYLYKRWRSIFPLYYVAFLYYYLKDVIAAGAVFYLGKPWTMLLSIFGLDGYLRYLGLNYYHVGEWFLGAIVLLYVLYPVYAKLLKKFGEKILIVLIPVWLWQLRTDVFSIPTVRNIIYCSGLFIVGMMIFRRELYRSKAIKGISFVTTCILLFAPIYTYRNERNILLIISLFFTLYAAGELIVQIPGIKQLLSFVAGISFPMYLVQNQIGSAMVRRFNPMTNTDMIKVMVIAVFLCIVVGWCVYAIAAQLMQTKWFGKLDQLFLKRK